MTRMTPLVLLVGAVALTGAQSRSGAPAGAAGGSKVASRLPGQQTAGHGVTRGIVSSLDLAAGTATLETGGEAAGQSCPITLHAVPTQLVSLSPGDVITVSYLIFDGVPWIQPVVRSGASGAGDLAAIALGGFSTVSGELTALDQAAGCLSVRGLSVRTHPLYAQGLAPGRPVAAQVVEVRGVRWATTVEPIQPGEAAAEGAVGGAAGQGGRAGSGVPDARAAPSGGAHP
jgi:hypothetical protein